MEGCRDIIIIGGGIAGMTAAIYAARANLDVLLLEREVCGGLANQTYSVENFPSYSSINGLELMDKVRDQVSELKVQIEEINEVIKIETGNPNQVITSEGEYESKSLILAPGRTPIRLPIETEWEEHIHYCSVCDGSLYQGKDVIVVGGGNSGFDESLYLVSLGVNSVQLLEAMDDFAADLTTREKAQASGKIEASAGVRIIDIKPEGRKGVVTIEQAQTGETHSTTIDGIFVFIGQKPNTAFLQGSIELDERGYIPADHEMKTSVPGVFAAGDVISKKYRQLTTAMSDGTIAALEAYQYIRSHATS